MKGDTLIKKIIQNSTHAEYHHLVYTKKGIKRTFKQKQLVLKEQKKSLIQVLHNSKKRIKQIDEELYQLRVQKNQSSSKKTQQKFKSIGGKQS